MEDKTERIVLRAMALVWEQSHANGVRPSSVPGIALPDGRFIFHGNQTYSTEELMLKYNPGAHIEWLPWADAVINATESDNFIMLPRNDTL